MKMRNNHNKSRCCQCGSEEIALGYLIGGGIFGVGNGFFFDPGHVKWYKVMFQRGVRVEKMARCCLACGLVWTGLNVASLKKSVQKKCDDSFSSQIYKTIQTENAISEEGCLNCGSNRKISGRLFTLRKYFKYSVAFDPRHFKPFKFVTQYVDLYAKAVCCADCGIVITYLNLKELSRFILKNCNREYVEQVYSHQAKQ